VSGFTFERFPGSVSSACICESAVSRLWAGSVHIRGSHACAQAPQAPQAPRTLRGTATPNVATAFLNLAEGKPSLSNRLLQLKIPFSTGLPLAAGKGRRYSQEAVRLHTEYHQRFPWVAQLLEDSEVTAAPSGAQAAGGAVCSHRRAV
jgi:hypothetical protein